MPQLDFFTFPHQYLIASLCFCGMYYFNLFFFFPQIKYFQLNKIFSINALAANVSVIEGDLVDIFSNLLVEENYIYSTFIARTRKLNKKFLMKKLAVNHVVTTTNSHNLMLSIFISFLFLFIFFKNFLVFNAEKLMLIYFLLVSSGIFFFLKNFLKNLIKEDLQKILSIAVDIEIEGEKTLELVKFFFKKLKINLTHLHLELLILKNLELKLINKIKW